MTIPRPDQPAKETMMVNPQRLRLALGLLLIILACFTVALASEKTDADAAAAPATQPAAPNHPDTPAWRAFERFKAMDGQSWQGNSTKGWTEKLSYSIIAGGSCVMEQSTMAHEGVEMVTMFHMDNDQLMLTHYCAAKNQPRMRATEISDDGSDVLFTFVDGTNLKNGRDTGHMDKAHIKFTGEGRMSAQWTFYSAGKEQWMEEITYHRAEDQK